jgi:hypothetical protein
MKNILISIALSLLAFTAGAQTQSSYEKHCTVVQVLDTYVEAPEKASINSVFTKVVGSPLQIPFTDLMKPSGKVQSPSTTTKPGQTIVLKCLGGVNLITVVQKNSVSKLKKGQDAVLESTNGTLLVAAI